MSAVVSVEAPSRLRYAGAGFLLGVGWAVVGRIWMRLISTEPSFSWAGTGELLVIAGLVGSALGLVLAARRRGGSGWWRLLGLLVPFFFAGAGMPLLPAVVLGGWGLRRGTLGRSVAVVGLVSAPVTLLAMTWDDVDHWLMPYPDSVYRAVLGGGGLLLATLAAWASTVVLAPWPKRADRRVAPTSEAVTTPT